MKPRWQTRFASNLRPYSRWLHARCAESRERGRRRFALEEYMLAKSFVIAMAADIARRTGKARRPDRSAVRNGMASVTCRAEAATAANISSTAASAMPDTAGFRRPTPLRRPQHVRRAGLRSEKRKAPPPFCWCANLYNPIELAGTFFPADGYVLLQQRETISLVCKTRYSPAVGRMAKKVRKDIPTRAFLGGGDGVAYRGDARRRLADWRVHLRRDVAESVLSSPPGDRRRSRGSAAFSPAD